MKSKQLELKLTLFMLELITERTVSVGEKQHFPSLLVSKGMFLL